MMNVKDMSDQEKSVMLAKLCGWIVDRTVATPIGPVKMIFWAAPGTREHYLPHLPKEFTWMDQAVELVHNLYDPSNMALAWRVLNWAYGENLDRFHELVRTDLLWYLYESPPEEAQRAWLDKILELAIDVGLVPSPTDAQPKNAQNERDND